MSSSSPLSTPKRRRKPKSSSNDCVEEVEGFFGCYLLVSRNERRLIRGRTYIGFTVNPSRRIQQHNAGKKAGGAWKTSQRGPWDMIVMVHGFPNMVSALRFEWAWQHPCDSRRLKNLNLKKRAKEKQLDFRIRVMAHMLRSEPWTRLSLTVRWLKEEYQVEFPPDLAPLSNVNIAFGSVKASKVTALASGSTLQFESVCHSCSKVIPAADQVSCLSATCTASFHIVCLARHFLLDDPHQLIPLRGHCPKCSSATTWTDIVKKNHVPSTSSHRILLSPSNSETSPFKNDHFDLSYS